MAGTSGDTGQPSVHAAWRMAQAATAARVYQPNPKLAALAVAGSIAGFEVVPGRLAERLELLSAARHPEALQAAEALLTDIVLLAEARSGADLRSFREELSGRRRAIGPPPG